MKLRPGQSLIEVTVAVLISAITATGIMSVVLSTKYSNVKADTKESAAVAFRSAQEYLKPYVSAAATNATYSSQFMPSGESIYGDTSWALADGPHNISFVLYNMPQFNGATLLYVVSDGNCNSSSGAQNLECRKVSFFLTTPE